MVSGQVESKPPPHKGLKLSAGCRSTVIMTLMKTNTDVAPVHASHLHLPFSSSSSASASCCGVSYLAATSISLAQLVCILAKPSRLWLDTTTTPTGLKPPPSGVLTAKPPAAWNRPKSLRLSGTHTVRFNFHNYACKSAMFVGISLAFSFGILLRVAHTRPPYSISARNKPS